MQSNEQEQLEAKRRQRRKEILEQVRQVRQRLAALGYPVPDDTAPEEIIVAAQIMRAIVEGRVLPPEGDELASWISGEEDAARKTAEILH